MPKRSLCLAKLTSHFLTFLARQTPHHATLNQPFVVGGMLNRLEIGMDFPITTLAAST